MQHAQVDVVALQRLLRDARCGDRDARARVVEAHLGLVRSIAARYRGFGLPFDDLVQEGALGLVDAVDRYDPARATDFQAFARFRIRRAIRNALTEQARLVRLPKQVVERRRAVARVEAELAAGGAVPTAAAVASVTGLSPHDVTQTRTAEVVPISLDQPVLADGSTLVVDVSDTCAADPAAELLAREEAQLVDRAVARLREPQRAIVAQHFGLDRPAATVAEIAAGLNLSERRTRTLERDALYELRAALVETVP